MLVRCVILLEKTCENTENLCVHVSTLWWILRSFGGCGSVDPSSSPGQAGHMKSACLGAGAWPKIDQVALLRGGLAVLCCVLTSTSMESRLLSKDPGPTPGSA